MIARVAPGSAALDLRLRIVVTGGRIVLRAARPVDRAFDHQFAEPDIVRPHRHHDHPHVVAARDHRELIGLGRLAEVFGTAFSRGPEIAGLRPRAGEVHLLVDRDRGALDRRHVGAMAIVRLARPVDALGVVFAAERPALDRGTIGPRARPERFRAVPEPAAALARDEAVAHGDDRRRPRCGGRDDEDESEKGEGGDPHGGHPSAATPAGSSNSTELARSGGELAHLQAFRNAP